MQYFRRNLPLAASLFLSLILLPTLALAQEPDAHLRDAQSYAKENGVDEEEAMRRLKLQLEIGELNAALAEKEWETFGGLWIEHTPEYRVVARFTPGGEKALQPYLEGGALEGLVEVRPARWTLAALEAAQQEALSAAHALGIPAESGINVRENRAELYVLDAAAVVSALAQGLRLPEGIEVVPVPELSTDEVNIYAGLSLSTCTSGFSVQNGSGTRGITTAAHCSNTQSYSGTSLPYQSGLESGSYDVQWHTAPGLTVTNQLYDGSGTRSITGTVSRTSQNVGDYVCKHGKTTGYTCGYISDKSYTRTTLPNSNATWIRVHQDGVNLSEGGDSGGPWFLVNSAYGIHACGIGDDACYMAVNYVSGLGVSVLTN